MSIKSLQEKMPSYAKDIKLNLASVISSEGIDGLNVNQTYQVALASAYTTKDKVIIDAIHDEVKDTLSDEEVTAAKAATTIMAMNNVYYRAVHLMTNKELTTLPAQLRMNIIGNPGIDKIDFELMSLAVSVINGCGMCIDSHVNQVIKGGISKQGVQSTFRIAAVVNAASQAISI